MEAILEPTVAGDAAVRESLLEIRGLRTYFYTESGIAKAVDGVGGRQSFCRCVP